MSVHTEKIKRRYDRASLIYDIFESPMEIMALKRWRVDLMKELKGNVLEVGVGTGKNISYYPEGMEITAIDFSEKMLNKSKLKAAALNKKVKFHNMDAELMDFQDNTFDTVFSTCVFCSVPDPIQGLKEIKRVCKPGGKIIMIEHVRSEKKVLGLIMDLLNPLVVNSYGANINRHTVDNIEEAGFSRIDVTNLFNDIVKKIIITNIK
jgi:ubiquinone/menaquinone biosynthesis C-methylase UbiE